MYCADCNKIYVYIKNAVQDTARNLNENVAFQVVMCALFFKLVRNSRGVGRN